MWELVLGENWSSQCRAELVPDDLAWGNTGTGGTNLTVDARRDAEALNCLKAVLLPAVSGYLVLCALLCVCLGTFFSGC